MARTASGLVLLLSLSSNGLVVRKRNVFISAGAFGLGDAFAQQHLEVGAHAVDQHRLRSAAVLGVLWQRLNQPSYCCRLEFVFAAQGVWGGACSPQVYQLSEWLIPGRSARRVLMKVGVSCGILSTCGNWVNMFVRRAATGTASLAETLAAVNSDLPRVMRHDLCVWPFYDVLCFSVIPPPLRPATTACVNACWACYVSFVAARAREK
jgi:hypothetical protein